MPKELERILQLLHGEHKFDPAVSTSQKQWWYNMAHLYLCGYLRFYARFEPEVVQELGL